MIVLVDMNLSPSWVRFSSDTGSRLFISPTSGLRQRLMRRSWTVPLPAVSLSSHMIWTLEPCSRCDVLPAAAGSLVLEALNAAGAHLAAGALVTIDPIRRRIRLLPIR